MSLTGLRNEPLSLDEVIAAVSRPEAGAIATFMGVVRNHNAGAQVAKLEYHAYAAMAEKELAAIAAEIESGSDVKVACLHRIGELAIGDVAVVCAASSPHRDAAFAASRQLIDRVKERVPIWKREHTGAADPHWVGWQDARVDPTGKPTSEDPS